MTTPLLNQIRIPLPRACFNVHIVFIGLSFLLFSTCIAAEAPAKDVKIEPIRIEATINKNEPFYRKSEKIEFKLSVVDESKDKTAMFLDCELFFNGKSIEKKMVPVTNGCIFVITPDQSGWVAAKAVACDRNKKPIQKKYPKDQFDQIVSNGIGVMVDPDMIKAAAAEPEDFDQFWHRQRAELDKVPIKADCTPVDFTGPFKDQINCFDVKIACAGKMPVSGYLAIPRNAKLKSLPAVVFFDGAGVRSATKPLWYQGAIAFHLNAHGIDNGQPNEYYRSLEQGELHNYKFQGMNSPDDFYFKGMHLRSMRALDYVKALPEWDGKNLIVFGGSMGGGQAIAAAALDPEVTVCLAFIPALGDLDGELCNRLAAYPQAVNLNDKKSNPESVTKTVRYYDSANFAKRIRGNVIITTGLIDFICPPTSAYLIYNSLPEKTTKKIIAYPQKGHDYYTPPEAKAILEKLYQKVAP